MECGLSDIFSRHVCSTVAKTTDVTNYAACFGAELFRRLLSTCEAAEMVLGPLNQQIKIKGVWFDSGTHRAVVNMSFDNAWEPQKMRYANFLTLRLVDSC